MKWVSFNSFLRVLIVHEKYGGFLGEGNAGFFRFNQWRKWFTASTQREVRGSEVVRSGEV